MFSIWISEDSFAHSYMANKIKSVLDQVSHEDTNFSLSSTCAESGWFVYMFSIGYPIYLIWGSDRLFPCYHPDYPIYFIWGSDRLFPCYHPDSQYDVISIIFSLWCVIFLLAKKMNENWHKNFGNNEKSVLIYDTHLCGSCSSSMASDGTPPLLERVDGSSTVFWQCLLGKLVSSEAQI